MENRGFTLIEMMITVMIATVVTLTLYYVNLAMTRAALQHESMAVVRDDGRLAMQQMARVLRMARETTIMTIDSTNTTTPLGTTAVDNIRFQPVDDVDANGVAIDTDFEVELAPIVVFALDANDANGDGLTTTQLCEFDANGAVVQVLSNNIDAGGLAFQETNGGVQISLQLMRPASGNRPRVVTRMDQVVSTRN